MTQHVHQFVRDRPEHYVTPEYYWKQVSVIGFMCYCGNCNRRVDVAGIIPKECPYCGASMEDE